MAKGAPLDGVSNSTYVHPVWLAPAESLPPVTSYELIICEDAACDDADDNVPPTRRETVVLQTSNEWAGPEAGHYVARFNGQDLVPGQSLTFKVRACNNYLDICGAENAETNCLSCGYYSNLLTLATAPAVPGESAAPTVEAINQTTITVGVGAAAYDGGINITRYEVRVRTLVSDDVYTACTSSSCALPLNWVLMDRRTDLQYEFTTRAVNALGAGPWSGVLNVESGAEDLPNRPSGLEVLSDPAVGSRSFSIAWDMPADNRSEGVLYYELTMTADGVDSERKLYASDITGGGEAGGWCVSGCTAAITTNVLPDTTYTLKIQAVNSLGSGLASAATLPFKTQADVPDKVTALQLDSVDQSSASLTWSQPSSNGAMIDKYRLHICVRYYADSSVGECIFEDVNPTRALAPGEQFTDQKVRNLASGKNFSLSIEVFNAQGSGGNSTTALEFTTHSTPMRGYPPVKQSALPGLSEKTTIRVAWTAPFSNGLPITKFNLSIDDGASFVVFSPGAGLGQQYTAGLEQDGFYPGTEHTFAVQAINELGGGAFSEVLTASTDPDVPGMPPAPVTDTLTLDAIVVQLIAAPYSGGESILYYELQLGHESDRVLTVPITEMTYSVSQRKLGTRYIFRSRAISRLGPGEWSSALEIESITSQYSSSPTDLVASDAEPRGFDVAWSMRDDGKTDGITQYQLNVFGGGSKYSLFFGGRDCRLGCSERVDATLFPEITPKTRYNLTLQAENAYGLSVQSNNVLMETLATAPDRLESVNVSDVSESSLTVSWALPADNGDPISSFAIYVCEIRWSEAGDEQGPCVVSSAAGPSSTSKVVEQLPSGRNYTVHVNAANAEGSSGNRSSAAAVTTLAVPMRGHPVRRQTPDLPGVSQTTAIHVVWDAPYSNGLPITNYTLEVDGSTTTVGLTDYTPQYVPGGLVPGTTHSVRVRAVNGLGAGEWSDMVQLDTQKDVPGRPSPPTNLGQLSETTLQVRVNPAPYTGGYVITRYELEVTYAIGGAQIAAVHVLNCSSVRDYEPPYAVRRRCESVASIEGYRKGATYQFRARAVSTDADELPNGDVLPGGAELPGEWSEVTEVLGTNTARPAAPTGLQSDDSSGDSCALDGGSGHWLCAIRLRWQQPAGNGSVTHYEVSYDESLDYCEPEAEGAAAEEGVEGEEGAACDHRRLAHADTLGQKMEPTLETCPGGPDSGYICATLAGLRPKAKYLVAVRAFNTMGGSSPSDAVSTATPVAPPDLVGSLNVSSVTSSSVSAVWRRPNSNGAPVHTYEMYACDVQDSRECHAISVAAASTAAALSGLPAGRNFTLQVNAHNSVGSSGNRTLECASEPCVTTHAVPMRANTPSRDEPLAGLPLDTTILVTWVPPFANGLPITSYNLVVDGLPTAVEATPDAPQFLHFGLLPGTEHTYSVSARNALGVGGLSDVLTAATANAVPATPLPPATDTVTDEASGAEELHVTIAPVAYSGMLGLPLANLSYEVEG